MATETNDLERLFGSNARMTAPAEPLFTDTARKLAAAAAALMAPQQGLEAGQIIRERAGLHAFSKPGRPFVFMGYLPEGEGFLVKTPRVFNVDCTVGMIDDDGDLIVMIADSRRWEFYPQDELEAAAALQATPATQVH